MDIPYNDFIIIRNDGILTLNNTEIICRKTDGKINATQLCKAGMKKRLVEVKNHA